MFGKYYFYWLCHQCDVVIQTIVPVLLTVCSSITNVCKGVYVRLQNFMVRSEISLQIRLQELMRQPQLGATTAEYAVVLIAAVGFAGLLVGLMKSDTVRGLLMAIIQQALQVNHG